ncbi:basic helix-loop-helix and HMG box domain-containing protein 1-like [Megalops cyprinoides]|uniref:basic helix-loop-helix and HMG box domain-containing protein 1-like n=1 Tax=Megalops cyprinoides TaxID=118141 RepID=UPI001863A2F1|nr:basic helix-loop-helix and HMG box domain-containing protein 1-like [Megalops cyprinoides]
MAPGASDRDTSRSKRREPRDWNSSWNRSLKEIAGLLPISDPCNGRGLTKKETLVHVLQYLDFLQNHIQSLQSRLPSHCLPKTHESGWGGCEGKPPPESLTPPPFLKARRKHVCDRPRKRPPPGRELWAEAQEKRWRLHKAESNDSDNLTEDEVESMPMWSGRCDWSGLQAAGSQGAWPTQDSDSPSSLESAFSPGQPSTLTVPPGGNCGDQHVQYPGEGDGCSDCEDRMASGESSSSSGVQDSPAPGSWALLLKDGVLEVHPSVAEEDSPLACGSPPRRASLPPLLPGFGARESLNLSPSLLTSPGRGVSHCLLAEGQEELQALFEDVWVTPKSSTPKVPSLPWNPPVDKLSESEGAVENGDGCLSSQSEGEDCNWTPTQRGPPRKGRHGQRQRGSTARGRQRSRPSLKKKCVNGFIMFCRINRKIYLRTHPGTPSTVVTKELAHLWHIMPKQERRVYCVKAWRFSRQQNRNVRSVGAEGEGDGEEGVASPLHMLLAHRDLYAAARGGR